MLRSLDNSRDHINSNLDVSQKKKKKNKEKNDTTYIRITHLPIQQDP